MRIDKCADMRIDKCIDVRIDVCIDIIQGSELIIINNNYNDN